MEPIAGVERPLIGMVHVGALPGTPGAREDVETICARAVNDARAIASAGFDAIIIENMHDVPYLLEDAVGPEIISAMTRVGLEVREAVALPLGVQILAGANRQAIAVAHAIGASFVRVEGFCYGHVADEGLIARAHAGELLRYRRMIGAERVRIWADICKKHASHAITGDLSLAEHARAAAFCGADALIVTGRHTGDAARIEDLQESRKASDLPVLVGSGVTDTNVRTMLAQSHGVIVGSWIKRGGDWRNEVDAARAHALVRAARGGEHRTPAPDAPPGRAL